MDRAAPCLPRACRHTCCRPVPYGTWQRGSALRWDQKDPAGWVLSPRARLNQAWEGASTPARSPPGMGSCSRVGPLWDGAHVVLSPVPGVEPEEERKGAPARAAWRALLCVAGPAGGSWLRWVPATKLGCKAAGMSLQMCSGNSLARFARLPQVRAALQPAKAADHRNPRAMGLDGSCTGHV